MKVVVKILFCSIIVFWGIKSLNAQVQYGNRAIEKKIDVYSNKSEDNEKKYNSLISIWNKGDLISVEEMFFLRCYYTTKKEYDASLMDSLIAEIYSFNENKKYKEAIGTCDELMKLCPVNVTSYKEKSYALKMLKKPYNNEWDKAIVIAKSMLFFTDNNENTENAGDFQNPFFVLCFEEGIILYDMYFGSYPEKSAIALYDKLKLMGVYFAHSSASRWAYLNHAKQFYPNPVEIESVEEEIKTSVEIESVEEIAK